MPRVARLGSVLLTLFLVACGGLQAPETLRVAAASSLRTVLPQIIEMWEAQAGAVPVVARYDASGTLRQQVEAGARTDVVLFAAAAPLDELIEAGLAEPESRTVIAYNRLVLIAPPGSSRSTVQRFKDLHGLPTGTHLAVGDPRYVPVGSYAREALANLGLWEDLQSHLILGTNVAAVLAWVVRGEAEYGIVYRSDAQERPETRVLAVALSPWAPHPELVGAVVFEAPASAPRFLRFIRTAAVQDELAAAGFEKVKDASD